MPSSTYILCPGQGAQVVGMGKDFYELSRHAREAFDAANDIVGFDLKAVAFGGPDERLNQTDVSQPAIYVTGVACYRAAVAAGKVDPAAVTARAREAAWADAGRADRPRLVTGAFVALGPDAEATLHSFGRRYLAVFGERPARKLSERMPLHEEGAVRRFLDDLAGTGCDELILVPASSDPDLLARLTDLVADAAP